MKSVLCMTFILLAYLATTPAKAALLTHEPAKALANAKAPQGGTLNFNLDSEPPTLNPLSVVDLSGNQVLGMTMDHLLMVNEQDHSWMPGLAEKAEVSGDGKSYTFKLRKSAKWSDGAPVSAEDVKFSFDAIFDNAYGAAAKRPYFENFSDCQIVDPLTIRFVAKEKYFGNLNSLGNNLWILPKHIYEKSHQSKNTNKTLIGSGPYILAEYEQGNRMVLKKNPLWWGNSIGYLKGQYNFSQIILRFAQEETVALEMLKKGELDFLKLKPDAFVKKAVGPEFKDKLIKVEADNKSPKSYGWVGWNEKNPLFQDRQVRLALQMLLNRPEMISKFLYDMSIPATGPWYASSDYADPKRRAVAYDFKAATELLRKAGWGDPDGDGILEKTIDGKKQDFIFTLQYGSKDYEKYLTLYQEDLRKAGIKMDLQFLQWNALAKNLEEKNFAAVALQWGGGDIDFDPKQIWHSDSTIKGGSNYIGYQNPIVDKKIDIARAELDRNKRIKLYREIFDLIADDAPYAFFFNAKSILYTVSNRIGRSSDTLPYADAMSPEGWKYWWVKQ